MNEISPQQLLSQMRAMNTELNASLPTTAKEVSGSGFGDMFKDAINQVNDTQMESRSMKRDFETGTGDKSLAEVMIASQKADLSFRAMTEVRNKLITAYQEIMNMPV